MALQYEILQDGTALLLTAPLGLATVQTPGLVQPDGETISVDNGVISAIGGGTVSSVDSLLPDENKNVATKILLTEAELASLENPVGSGLYPSLANMRAIITDGESEDLIQLENRVSDVEDITNDHETRIITLETSPSVPPDLEATVASNTNRVTQVESTRPTVTEVSTTVDTAIGVAVEGFNVTLNNALDVLTPRLQEVETVSGANTLNLESQDTRIASLEEDITTKGHVDTVDGISSGDDKNVQLKFAVTQAEYNALKEADTLVKGARYLITDAPDGFSCRGLYIGFEAMHPGDTPPTGWLDQSILIGELPRDIYKDLWLFAESSGNIISDSEWLDEVVANGVCGAFSYGDGTSTFRVPLRRRTYVRASDPETGLKVGQYQKDAQQNITGAVYYAIGSGVDRVGGSIKQTRTSWVTYLASTGNEYLQSVTLDSSLQVRTADEVRVKTIVRLPVIYAFDTTRNEADIEVGGLVTQLGTLNNRVDVSQQVMHVQDRKAVGVPGGTFTAGWRVRDLNTVLINTIPGASLANNRITLPPGTYEVFGRAPALRTDTHLAQLLNIDLSKQIMGTTAYSTGVTGSQTDSFIQGIIKETVTTTWEIQHYAGATYATQGFGVTSLLANAAFSSLIIRRIS